MYLPKINNNQRENKNSSSLLEPSLLSSARRIYNTYCQLHSQLTKEPIGVAVDPKTSRGQLLFTEKPILLPGELFVPVSHLESEIYEKISKVK